MDRRVVLAAMATFAAAGSIGACSSAPGGDPFRPAMVAEGHGVIYVFRSPGGALGEHAAVRVWVDDTEVEALAAGRYLAIVAEPGDHFVRVEGEGEAVAGCRVADGDSIYLRVEVRSFGRVAIETMESASGRAQISRTVRAGSSPAR